MKRIVFTIFTLIILIMLLMMSANQPEHRLQAQDDSTPSVVMHVVAPNETLGQIAAQYGTTADAIMAANNIDDARFIDVGQPLVVPNVQQPLPTGNFRHTVALGETLVSIAAQYAVPVQLVIERNHIVHPNRLYIGQPLIIGEIGQPNTDYGYYTVQPDDHAAHIAARFGMTLDELIIRNHLSRPTVIVPGQRLIVRGIPLLPIFPLPFTSLRLTPADPMQGQSVSIQFTTSTDVTVEGQFLGRAFTPIFDNGAYHGVVAVHSFTPRGVYSLTLDFTATNGQHTHYELRLWVGEGGYGSESINIPEDRSNLLEPSLVQEELDRVAAIMSGFDTTRRFNGLMVLPNTGPITSDYGTRRSYNGSPYNTFHGGTDFGGAVGSPIIAPADGIVVLAEPLVVRGNVVIVDHGWGVYTGYWHLSEIGVQAGQQVQKGEVLGLLGSTGLVTGAHLHWEMWVQGIQVDPMQWVQQAFP